MRPSILSHNKTKTPPASPSKNSNNIADIVDSSLQVTFATNGGGNENKVNTEMIKIGDSVQEVICIDDWIFKSIVI